MRLFRKLFKSKKGDNTTAPESNDIPKRMRATLLIRGSFVVQAKDLLSVLEHEIERMVIP